MEDLAAKQRVCRPLGEDVARRASSDGGSAAVDSLDYTPAERHPTRQRLSTSRSDTTACNASHCRTRHGKISTYGADERSAW